MKYGSMLMMTSSGSSASARLSEDCSINKLVRRDNIAIRNCDLSALVDYYCAFLAEPACSALTLWPVNKYANAVFILISAHRDLVVSIDAIDQGRGER